MRNIEQTAAHLPAQSDLSAEDTTESMSLPNELVMKMKEPLSKIVEMESDNLRYTGVFDSGVVEMEDPRCQNLNDRSVLEIEDCRCNRQGMEMEDSRCQGLRYW